MREHIFLPKPSFPGYVCFPDFVGGYKDFAEHQENREAKTGLLGLDRLYNLHLIYGGRGFVQWDGRRYELTRGNGFLFGPGLPQHYGADPTEPWEIRWIHFYGSHLDELLQGNGSGEVWLFSYTEPDRIERLTEAILHMARHYQVEDAPRLSSLLYELLLHLSESSSRLNAPSENTTQRIHQAANYIRQHCKEGLSLGDMAETAGYSSHYFSRKFGEIMGKTPMEFLLEARILQAKRLLIASNLSIKHIALEVGFHQSSYFIQCFRRVVSVTPEQFRAMYMKSPASAMVSFHSDTHSAFDL